MVKKTLMVLLVVAFALVALAAPAAAVPVTDLNVLASHYPAKTPIFVSFRTDDAYLDTLDSLTARLREALPDADIPALRDSLDRAIAESGLFGEDGNFASAVRSWLGDVASLGVISFDVVMDTNRRNDDELPILLTIQVIDRAAAETFWDAALLRPDAEYERSETEGYTLYTHAGRVGGNQPFVAVGDDRLFIASERDLLPLEGRLNNLAEAAVFIDTLALLPASDYNITAYLNLAETVQRGLAQVPASEQAGLSMLMPLLENLPAQVIGLTILDERSLVIDIVQPFGGMMEALGMSPDLPGPVNPALAERIPAGMPLVIHATDLAAAYTQGVQSLRLQASMMVEMAAGAPIEMMGRETALTPEAIDRALAQFRFVIQGATGLNWENELLPALTGDYALFLGVNPALAGERITLPALMAQTPVDFGLIVAIDDPAIIDALVEGLTNALRALPVEEEDAEITFATDTIGGQEVQLVTIRGEDTPFPIELVLGGDDEVLFLGTPNAARAALSPDGGLLADTDYQEASGYLLSEPRSVAYLASAGLQPIVNIMGMMGGRSAERDAEQLAAVLSLVRSATISQTYAGDVSYARAVWTLPE